MLEAAGPAEAEQVCRSTPDRIDLLLTDFVMPDTDGRQLAEKLIRLRPEMKVILMSGFFDEIPAIPGPGAWPMAFLPKPFTAETLVGKIRAVLEGK